MKISILMCGDKRDRTADLLNAIQALSQLSYIPFFFSENVIFTKKDSRKFIFFTQLSPRKRLQFGEPFILKTV